MDNVQSKTKKTGRNFVYRYLFSEAQPGKPTLLFVHGFPSTSYDWYHQINYFQPKGYGLIVPDMLGYGRTEPKSLDVADFLYTAVAQDLVDILDQEGIQSVIAVGHDWGSFVVSGLSLEHSDRFLGFAFTAIQYLPPSVCPPLDVILEYQKQTFGRPLLGYWTLFTGKDDAANLIEANIDSFLDILYPADPEVWKTYMNPPGELEQFIEQKRRLQTAPYLTPEHYEHIRTSLLQGKLDSPLNWYRSRIKGINDGNTDLPEEDVKVKKPTFLAVAKYDYVGLRDYVIAEMEKYAKGGLTIVEFETGHWLYLEKPQEYNDALERWVIEL